MICMVYDFMDQLYPVLKEGQQVHLWNLLLVHGRQRLHNSHSTLSGQGKIKLRGQEEIDILIG